MTSNATYKIGMFGAGTVGGGVVELLQRIASRSAGSSAVNMIISKICVRDLAKPRDFTVDGEQTQFTTDPEVLLGDDSLDCIVEVIGGTGLARTIVMKALQAGKTVVTANKALLAEHMPELQTALKENPKSRLAYEAAVCGGIPIIQTLQSCFPGDNVQSVMGICNGTTNYMLTKMELEGADYNAVLKEAQDLGYAEADPTADVEGHDVRAKICLLAKLASGVGVPVADIPCKGISSIDSIDFKNAYSLNRTIKLIGTASTSASSLSVYVTPMMVPQSHFLGTIRGPGNAVAVTSQNMGLTTYQGPGAGRYPTANSVVADIVRAAQGMVSTSPFGPETGGSPPLALDGDYSASFYIRILLDTSASVGVDAVSQMVDSLASAQGIPIATSLQASEESSTSFFFVTQPGIKISQVDSLCAAIAQHDVFKSNSGKLLALPLLASD